MIFITDEGQLLLMNGKGRIPPGGRLMVILALLITCAVIGAGCTSQETSAKDAAKSGDEVRVMYSSTFDDGTIYIPDTNWTFVIGSEPSNPVEQAVIGMKPGDERTINTTGEQVYGPHRPELVQEVARTGLFANQSIKVGDIMRARSGNRSAWVQVVGINDTTLVVDENNPLAGKPINLTFKVTLIKILPK